MGERAVHDGTSRPRGWTVIGHRAFDGLSVAAVLDVHRVLAAEGSPTVDGLVSTPPAVRSLESDGVARRRWTNLDIDQVVEHFLEDLVDGSDAGVLPYASSKRLTALASEGRIRRVLAPADDLRAHLDDKAISTDLFREIGLAPVPQLVGRLATDSDQSAAQQFGRPYVLRGLRGSTGSSVHLIHSEEEFDRLWERLGRPDTKWLFERYVEGYSVNVTGVCFEDGTAVFPPSLQVIGDPLCTDLTFGFCGSDYISARSLTASLLDAMSSQTGVVGHALAAIGYRGIFGIDFLVGADGSLWPSEINPRFQNSTALLNFAYASARRQSPAALHIAACAGERRPHEGAELEVQLSQLIMYAPGRPGCSSRNVYPLDDGEYSWDGTELRAVGALCDPLALEPDRILVAGAAARPQMRVLPGSALVRLVFAKRVLADDNRSLRSDASRLLGAVRKTVLGHEVEA